MNAWLSVVLPVLSFTFSVFWQLLRLNNTHTSVCVPWLRSLHPSLSSSSSSLPHCHPRLPLWHHWAPNSRGERVSDGRCGEVGGTVEEEGWRDRETEIDRGAKGWGSAWRGPTSPEEKKKKKGKKQTKTGSTDLTDFTKLQSRDTAERRENGRKGTKQ